MLVHCRLTSSIKFAGTHLYTWVERSTVKVKCLAQEHNTMSLIRAWTRTAHSRGEHANHATTMPPTCIMCRSRISTCLPALWEVTGNTKGVGEGSRKNSKFRNSRGNGEVGQNCRKLRSSVVSKRMDIDHFHKWRPIINSFANIKISLSNLILKLIIQKSFYSETRLVRLI